MSKSNGGQTTGGQSPAAGSKTGSPGRGRAPNGFYGGNWPGTTGGTSGGNRGNAAPSGGKG
ncbi:hypothetical protein F6X42_41010 [Paraburkholderia sp. WC7.3b]|uniref:Uncharacterized protein n=1 Tax=Paraburkholderia podalyriae TaxID=1938811 RepID=A0ABR7Q222_9BURK|nr:hypothetical protein [Paraburkholderia podalyriae]